MKISEKDVLEKNYQKKQRKNFQKNGRIVVTHRSMTKYIVCMEDQFDVNPIVVKENQVFLNGLTLQEHTRHQIEQIGECFV